MLFYFRISGNNELVVPKKFESQLSHCSFSSLCILVLVQRAIASIEARLQGVVVGVGAAPSLPLSVEGQAHRLIAEAVSHSNLSKMYIWWMAWF